jgi:hypothetical protein
MNCWDCGLNKLGGMTLLGKCMWFDEPKEIPPHVVDKGCKFWRSKFAQEIIEKFDGELIL